MLMQHFLLLDQKVFKLEIECSHRNIDAVCLTVHVAVVMLLQPLCACCLSLHLVT